MIEPRVRPGAFLILSLLTLLMPLTHVLAEEPGESAARIARGKALAEAHCAKCHAVGLTDESPTWANSNTAFRALYERYPIAMLEEAARTGSISGHDEMPGFDFTLADAEALLAYIDSLAPDKPGYVTHRPQR